MSRKKKSDKIRVGIVVSEFNKEVTEGLLNGAVKTLNEYNIDEKNIRIIKCPGAFEIPAIAKQMCITKKYDAVVCLGAVIKGETAHFEYISMAVSAGIAQLNLEYDIPVAFGVLTCYSEEQAARRSADDDDNKGREAAHAALSMIKILRNIKK